MIKVGEFLKNLYTIYWLEFKLIINGFDLLFFYLNIFIRDDIAKKSNLFLIKTIFFQNSI